MRSGLPRLHPGDRLPVFVHLRRLAAAAAFRIGLGKGALTAAGNGKQTPITDSESFKAATAKLGTPNGGIFYVNVSDALDEYMNSGVAPEDFDDKNLRPIKAVGAAGAPGVSTEGVATSRMVVYIAK